MQALHARMQLSIVWCKLQCRRVTLGCALIVAHQSINERLIDMSLMILRDQFYRLIVKTQTLFRIVPVRYNSCQWL